MKVMLFSVISFSILKLLDACLFYTCEYVRVLSGESCVIVEKQLVSCLLGPGSSITVRA